MTRKITLFLCISVLLGACSANQKSTSIAETDEWPEMDEFHMVMAESFHPYMDSGNLAPAKANAVHLARMAEEWSEAPLPSRVDNEEVKQKLVRLAENSMLLSAIKDSGTDEEIGAKLRSLHNIFHEIQDAWYSGK